MTPTFKYIKDPELGSAEAVSVTVQEGGDKTPEKKVKKKRKKAGSSLGWGWFQGFNLFINACFLFALLVLAYFIVGTDDRHEGLPKYIIDKSNDGGMAMFNPQLPLEVQKSFVYVPPVKRPTLEKKPELGEIKLLSEVTPDRRTVDENLPKLELLSSVEESQALENEPFGLTMATLQLESTRGQESAQANTLVNPSEISHLSNIAREAIINGHLMEPYEGSALAAYQEILVRSPNHQLGLSGLNELATIYLRRAEAALNLRNFTDALKNVELGLKADPNHVKLNKLNVEISAFLQE